MSDAQKNPLNCNFCGKNEREVICLIQGPMVQICDECTDLCSEIVKEQREKKDPLRDAERPSVKKDRPWWYWFVIDHWFKSCDHPVCNKKVNS